MIKCKHCSVEIEVVPGKVQKQFCSDAHRKAYKRANSGKSEATGCPSVDEPWTDGTKQPRTSTADKPTSDKPERTAQGNIRVSKPGEADYVPMCETARAFVEGRDKRPESGKRGKDIKHFGDLPMDVQEVIHRLSTTDGKIDQTIKANRTAIAVNYQHQFPDRFHSTSVECVYVKEQRQREGEGVA